jgi:LPXTG-motif cell wall-anchored protein
VITFDERPVGSPEAIKAWFYPGDNYGHEFVYPKAKAVTLAKTSKQPVPSMPTELAANTVMPVQAITQPHVVAMKQTSLKAQTPTEEEIDIAEVFAVVPLPAPSPTTLPQTGSSMPLIALLGFLSLGMALCLHKVASLGNKSN